MGSLKSYIAGFVISLILTLASFFTVTLQFARGWHVLAIISIFATTQALVQLFLFLHLGHEESPRWKLIVFIFMAIILVAVVFGSLWVMGHLDYRMMDMGH